MFRRKIWLLVLLLLLSFTLVPTVSAAQPIEIQGYFDQYVLGDPTVYCIRSGPAYGVSDGFLDGCVVQPDKPGLAQQGIWTGTVNGLAGTCKYTVRTFLLDGVARGVFSNCTGELAGFHLIHVLGGTDGLWSGSYFFTP